MNSLKNYVLAIISVSLFSVASFAQEIEEIIGIDASGAVFVSAKRGDGVEELLETLIEVIPAPDDTRDLPPQALIR